MKPQQLFFILLVLLFSTESFPQEGIKLRAEQWEEDFNFLVEKVQNTVPNFNTRENSTIFTNRVEQLKQGLDSKSFDEIVFGIQYLLNTLEDEGCNILPFQKKIDTKVVPIKTYWFADGLFVCDASSAFKAIIGEQIVKINGFNVDEVYLRLSDYLNADNKHYKKHLFHVYSLMPSLLMVAGIGDSNTQMHLQFSSGKEVTLTAESVSEYIKLKRKLPNDEYFSFTKTDHSNENYWMEYLPNSNTLFVQIQKVKNKEKGTSFSTFIKTIETEIKNGNTDKIILDLRYGGGGNGFKLKVLTDLLRASETINNKGNLFVLTSKATRGTLLELTSILSLNTKAILVGEPTGEGPNTVGDTKFIKLPNSGLSISLTHTFWPTSWDNDYRKTIRPEVPIAYNFNQHTQSLDPWIEASLLYKNEFTPHKIIDKNLSEKIKGAYKIEGRKVTITNENGKYFMKMNRKMKSFFEIKTEIYFHQVGVLSTDIDNVFLHYDKSFMLSKMHWKDVVSSIKK